MLAMAKTCVLALNLCVAQGLTWPDKYPRIQLAIDLIR